MLFSAHGDWGTDLGDKLRQFFANIANILGRCAAAQAKAYCTAGVSRRNADGFQDMAGALRTASARAAAAGRNPS